jgi:hypothetical protein
MNSNLPDTRLLAFQELYKRRVRRHPELAGQKILRLFGVTQEQMEAEQKRTGQSFVDILGIGEALRQRVAMRRAH